MHYRTIFLVAALTVLLSACSLAEVEPSMAGSDMKMSASMGEGFIGSREGIQTKSALCDNGREILVSFLPEPASGCATKSAPVNDIFDSMTCFGYTHPTFNEWSGQEVPDLFFAAKCTKGGSWSFVSGSYKWPGASKSVRVYGFSPAIAEGLSVVSTASTPGAPVIEYKVKTDVASQLDLLEGVSDANSSIEGVQDYDGKGGSDIRVGYRHALAAMRFRTVDLGFDCTIKKISLKGVMSKGRTALMSGEWSDLSEPADYVIEPGIAIGSSGEYVTDESMTIFLIPQVLGSSSTLELEFLQGGQTYVVSAPMSGVVLKVNTMTTVKFFFKDSEISPEISIQGLSNFTNTDTEASQTVVVTSCTAHSSGVMTPEPWEVTGYSTDGGVTFTSTKPDWLTLSKTSGTGGNTGEDLVITVGGRTPGTEKIFIPSETEDINYNTALKAMSEIGTSSSPVDLSLKDYLGNDIASSTTANCYVVHQPGWYKIPLVYGNAIKNGTTNSAAFYNATAETKFEDSWGNVFTALSSPYVKDHGAIASAEKLWCDTICEVDGISEDDNYLYFHIPAETIEQSNILLGVKDSDGNVAWSWHVWVTGRNLSPVTITNENGVNFDIMPVNLGWNGWGTEGTASIYAARSCVIRLKQTNGTYIGDITVNCPKVISASSGSTVRGSSPYYQWGRKDPFISIGSPTSGGNIEHCSSAGAQSQAHQNPKVPYISSNSNDWTTDTYYYFWDADNTTTGTDSPIVKTIYDPCPAGWNIPQYNTFTGFSTSNVVGAFNQGWYFKRNSSDGVGVYFPAVGYRNGNDASFHNVASCGYYWLSVTYNIGNDYYAYYLGFGSNTVNPNLSGRSHELSVRPCRSTE